MLHDYNLMLLIYFLVIYNPEFVNFVESCCFLISFPFLMQAIVYKKHVYMPTDYSNPFSSFLGFLVEQTWFQLFGDSVYKTRLYSFD